MNRMPWALLAISILFFTLLGCSSRDMKDAEDIARAPLQVGITPDYPPLIFMSGGNVTGVEADLARLLTRALDRPLRFVQMRWNELIPALMSGKIDIIMSGMTKTKAREVRIGFSNPYFKSGLLVAMRTEDVREYSSTDSILQTMGNVGAIKGTTGEVFLEKNFPRARKMIVASPKDGAFELKRRRIDLFLTDGPAVVWLVSENEAELTGHWELLNEEYLAWGLRRDDQELLTATNRILEEWKKDGTLVQVLSKWLPYLEFGE